MNKKAPKSQPGPELEIPNKPVLERTAPSVLTLRFPEVSSGWEQWVLLTSDHHWDNPLCDRDLLRAHLDKAVQRNAVILIFGDLFCAMQGKHDPRRSLGDVRPEHYPDGTKQGPSYLDLLASTAAEFYGPYAPNIALISEGNHEASVRENCGVSLLSNLAHRLNSDHGGQVTVGPYSGWVRFFTTVNKSKNYTRKLKYHHGSGGGGAVTRGVIQTNRQAVYLPDADIVVNGHTHDAWVVPVSRDRITDSGVPFRDVLWFARTPSFKNEYGANGFADQRWHPPKPLGSIWMRLTCDFKGARQLPGVLPLGIELTPEVE